MKIWGKVIGGVLGLAAGGPVGATVGFIIGHVHDMQQAGGPRAGMIGGVGDFSGTAQQSIFTTGVIVLGAKMAKADGRVTRNEIEAFKRAFQVTPAQTSRVGRLFDQARRSADGFEPYAFQLAQAFRQHPAVLEEILSGLFIVAAADNTGLSPAEVRFLTNVASIFNFNAGDFDRIASSAGVRFPEKPRDAMQESLAILGIAAQASPGEIKLAYRALIREHHPDKLIAQGLPPEFLASANEKMKRINVAYDTVCRARGIK